MKYRFLLIRHWQDRNQTFGTLIVFDDHNKPVFSCSIVERGFIEGDLYNSCFRADTLQLKWEWSHKFGRMLWEIYGTYGKTECKFHVANTWPELQGCCAVGIKLKDINKDGYIDVTDSTPTLDLLHRATKGQTEAVLEVQEWF